MVPPLKSGIPKAISTTKTRCHTLYFAYHSWGSSDHKFKYCRSDQIFVLPLFTRPAPCERPQRFTSSVPKFPESRPLFFASSQSSADRLQKTILVLGIVFDGTHDKCSFRFSGQFPYKTRHIRQYSLYQYARLHCEWLQTAPCLSRWAQTAGYCQPHL